MKEMTSEISELYSNHKPLPPGTRIKSMDGDFKVLSQFSLTAANKVPNHLSEYLPFWMLGWTDLHDKLLGPSEPIPPATSLDQESFNRR